MILDSSEITTEINAFFLLTKMRLKFGIQTEFAHFVCIKINANQIETDRASTGQMPN